MSDPKFDSLIMDQMEECFPGENLYLIFVEDQPNFTYDKTFNDRIIFEGDISTIDYNKIDGIIIHYLNIQKANFLVRMPKHIPIGFSIWGGDFYNFLPKIRKYLYSEMTKDYLSKNRRFPALYYKMKDEFFFPMTKNSKLWNTIVKRSKVYSTVIPYEKRLVEKYFNPSAKHLSLPTYSIDKILDVEDYEWSVIRKNNCHLSIMIGNSGISTNNHLEILYFFKRIINENIRLHLPLTYGNKGYIDHICNVGISLYGDKFNPLLRHLNQREYVTYLNKKNIFIFNSYRQQGIGTIVQALWSGGKVFLSNKNISGIFYKDYGIKIFSIEDDLFKSNISDLSEPLTSEEILTNRNKLYDLYSNITVNNSIKIFFDSLKGNSFLNKDIYKL